MKTLLKNGRVVNVFTLCAEDANVLLEDGKILGVGDYTEADADVAVDLEGGYLCPGFIDGHIHIESSMMLPYEFARAAVPHGTTAVVADPHEIANVCGRMGIAFMLDASRDLPMSVFAVLPSCVPATPFDEAGAVLEAEDLEDFYRHPRVLGLGEVMNYPGVCGGDPKILEKVQRAVAAGKTVNGHAPLLGGRMLDRYVAAGIEDDHECSSAEEARERIRKGQWVMIRQGTAARNLEGLISLFDPPYCYRCLLVTDDKHPADLLAHGHIDHILRMAVSMGKDPFVAIRMATLQAAEHFGLRGRGAVAPGYRADLVLLDDLTSFGVRRVFFEGREVARDGRALPFDRPTCHEDVVKGVRNSFNCNALSAADFHLDATGTHECHVIGTVRDQLLTEDRVMTLDLDCQNGVDTARDVCKVAVVERHMNTGHVGLGFLTGLGLTRGAIASSVSHDSHNLIVLGTSEEDMAAAANRVLTLHGGAAVVCDGRVLAEMPLPYAGLMTDLPAEQIAALNAAVRRATHELGVPEGVEAFMTTAFVSLPVIPHLKMTTRGLVDVDRMERIELIRD